MSGFCPACGGRETSVVDSRPVRDSVMRRRKCDCGHAFTTYETSIDLPLLLAEIERFEKAVKWMKSALAGDGKRHARKVKA